MQEDCKCGIPPEFFSGRIVTVQSTTHWKIRKNSWRVARSALEFRDVSKRFGQEQIPQRKPEVIFSKCQGLFGIGDEGVDQLRIVRRYDLECSGQIVELIVKRRHDAEGSPATSTNSEPKIRKVDGFVIARTPLPQGFFHFVRYRVAVTGHGGGFRILVSFLFLPQGRSEADVVATRQDHFDQQHLINTDPVQSHAGAAQSTGLQPPSRGGDGPRKSSHEVVLVGIGGILVPIEKDRTVGRVEQFSTTHAKKRLFPPRSRQSAGIHGCFVQAGSNVVVVVVVVAFGQGSIDCVLGIVRAHLDEEGAASRAGSEIAVPHHLDRHTDVVFVGKFDSSHDVGSRVRMQHRRRQFQLVFV
mmetsp:Transcript_4723/g.5350  ORF Transcript_4723/g.5350 Transcript_4723/m.5350 type:complete len:356 (-) Transcript_4723:581-1648(-)